MGDQDPSAGGESKGDAGNLSQDRQSQNTPGFETALIAVASVGALVVRGRRVR
jgi:hypothetical protein